MTTPLSGAGSATAVSSSKGGWASLGAGDFMKVLTAQLKNQDPTEPVDNAQMVAQLAQFSSLSNATETNGTLKAILAKLDSIAPAA